MTPTDPSVVTDGPDSQTPAPNDVKDEKGVADQTSAKAEVTTDVREPLKIPDTVHIKITPGNLKDYLGPPTYHNDRLYTTTPPSGVSTGLGYLGNGSGAVMPIEAVVSRL